MIITIPSYKRADRMTTVDFLGDAFSREEIIIGTQTQDDYEAYCERYGQRATIIFKEGHSCGDNRNNLLEWCERNGVTETLQLDDDIRFVRTMYNERIKGADFRELMEKCFELSRKAGVTLFGGSMTDNAYFMRATAKPSIIVGMLSGILDTSIRYDPQFKIKHDFELSLRLMKQGRKVVRFNSFAPSAAHQSAGGCSEWWKRGDYRVEAEWLVAAFPDLVKLNPRREGEILFIGK